MAETKSNLERLMDMLKFNPTKEVPTKDALTAALKEVQEERTTKLKAKAKEQLTKAIDLSTKHKFHQINHEAEAELQQLERSIRTVRKPSEYKPTTRVAESVAAIHGRREEAGLAR